MIHMCVQSGRATRAAKRGETYMARVVVGLSGGVDSAAAAYLLKQAGHEVIGVTLRTWESGSGEDSRCCEIDDARSVAQALGIPFYTLNCTSDFREHVIRPFVREYLRGRTPNPCVVCNRAVKWERMQYMARVLQADFVATGHYASVVRLPSGRYTVRKALHAEKDQTYMLYRLTQQQLAMTLMPLGELSKPEVRQIAAQAGIPVAGKKDSQEICFVPDGSYTDFIAAGAESTLPGEGPFVDEAGNRLGTHRGIIHYTVGQRRGLGLATGHHVYVKELRPETNEVVIGDEQSLYADSIICEDVCWMSVPGPEPGKSLLCSARIRYRHEPCPAVLKAIDGGRIRVCFEDPVRAPAPGQSAVFYDGDGCVIGGGIITAE